jgi:hypothetical protein
VSDPTISPGPGRASTQDLESLAPSRDDTLRSLPDREGGATLPGPEPSSKPRREWSLRRAVVTFILFALFFGLRHFGHGSQSDQASRAVPVQQIPPAIANSGPEVLRYLGQVEAVCQAHDRLIASHPGKTPLDKIVRSETSVTSQIAAIPAPSDASEMRRAMLQARRGVDEIAERMYRLMVRSSDPPAVRRQLLPMVSKRVDHMYGTFASFGIYCHTNPGS